MDNLKKASEKINHAPFYYKGKGKNEKIGIVVVHGFTGSPHSMRDWAHFLASKGYQVRMPLLPGHGTSPHDLKHVHWQEWQRAVFKEIYQLNNSCSAVFIAGLSMGGALSLRAAEEAIVDGAVIVNPALTIPDKRSFLLSIMKYFVKTVPGIGNDIKKSGVTEGAYTEVSVSATHELKKLLTVTRRNLNKIKVPILLFRSTKDKVVPDSDIRILEHKVGKKYLEKQLLHESYHVATVDNDAHLIFEESEKFIQAIISTLPSSSREQNL
ncbi:MAG: alpha/beta fold hydrolase [Micrococcaceae bacterium]